MATDLEELNNLDEDEENGMTMQELFAHLLIKEELIITVFTSEIDKVKAGLISVKGKENSKMKSKGMPIDNSKLSITLLPPTEGETPEDCSRLHIALVKRKTVAVLKMEEPSDF